MSLCFFFQLCIQPGQVSIIDSALGRTCPAEFNKTTKQRCFTLVTGTSSHWLALKPRHSCTDYSFLSSNPPINSALLQFPPLHIFINPKITFFSACWNSRGTEYHCLSVPDQKWKSKLAAATNFRPLGTQFFKNWERQVLLMIFHQSMKWMACYLNYHTKYCSRQWKFKYCIWWLS